jgi:ferritin
MLNKKIEEVLNKHLTEEMYSSYLYLSMSAYCDSISLKGFAHWMKIQSQEEYAHVEKIFDYIQEKQGKVTLAPINGPKVDWKNIIDVFEDTLEHEEKVSEMINVLATTALEEKDHATSNFLQWFVTEQVEEEAHVSEMLDQLKLVEGKGAGLFMLDREAKQRVFVPTQPAA